MLNLVPTLFSWFQHNLNSFIHRMLCSSSKHNIFQQQQWFFTVSEWVVTNHSYSEKASLSLLLVLFFVLFIYHYCATFFIRVKVVLLVRSTSIDYCDQSFIRRVIVKCGPVNCIIRKVYFNWFLSWIFSFKFEIETWHVNF